MVTIRRFSVVGFAAAAVFTTTNLDATQEFEPGSRSNVMAAPT